MEQFVMTLEQAKAHKAAGGSQDTEFYWYDRLDRTQLIDKRTKNGWIDDGLKEHFFAAPIIRVEHHIPLRD